MPVDPRGMPPAADDPLAADDPCGALRRGLLAPADPLLPAEDMVLAWLLHLSADIDPAHAAGRILDAVAATAAAPAADQRLTRLLAEIACWPAARLQGARRRRGCVTQ